MVCVVAAAALAACCLLSPTIAAAKPRSPDTPQSKKLNSIKTYHALHPILHDSWIACGWEEEGRT